MTTEPGRAIAPDQRRIEAAHFNPDGSLRASAEALDHFAFLGLPRRLMLDVPALREAFLAFSRRFHPDYFGQSNADQRRLALEKTAQLNGAWRTLGEAQPRAEYLLSLVAPQITPGKNSVPPDLLEEMMDIQEAGEDLRNARLAGNPAALAAAESRVRPLREQAVASRARIERSLPGLFADFDSLTDRQGEASPQCAAVLGSIRGALDQMNYLRTVIRNLR